MSDILVNNQTGETRWPASFGSLLVFSGVSLQKTSDRPVTAGVYTLHRPAQTAKPVGDVVVEVAPVQVDGVWTQQWEVRSYTSDERAGLIKSACDSIDLAADAARRRFVSPGDLIDQEYKEAYNQAKSWLDSGADIAAVPVSVLDEAAVRDLSPVAAAEYVVATGDQWAVLLMSIRKLRNQGKAAVNAAAGSDVLAVAQQWVDQLNAIGVVE